jgi:hypothetical protein
MITILLWGSSSFPMTLGGTPAAFLNEIAGFVDSRLPVARLHHHATSAVYPPASPHGVFSNGCLSSRGPQGIRRNVVLLLHWDQLARSFGQKFYLHGAIIWLDV